jgi:cell division septum initiation protein DivIVA
LNFFVSKNNSMSELKNQIITHVTKICDTIDSLESNIDKINQKVDNISKLFYQLSYNSSLPSSDTNSYLKFQIEQLENEKSYFTNIKRSLKEKLVTDIYTISESILMLLSSIENIKIDQEAEKKSILKKIFALKKFKKRMETSELLELINSTLHNLELINEFVKLFDVYIKDTITKHKRENLHLNNFKANLEHKKNHIVLEYEKFSNKIEELVEYFLAYATELSKQLEHQKILDFFVNKNEP